MEAVTRAGDMRARVRDFDWSATPLGPAETWPPSLTWSVELILASGFPMSVRWGPDLIMIYNDAYAGLLGERHPRVLGKPLREAWPEIYSQLGPLNQAILRGERDNFFAEDHLWLIHRYGIPEDARFTISYSPIPDPTAPNGIGGVSDHRLGNHRARAQRKDAARSHRTARERNRAAHARTRPDLEGVRGSARRRQFRWLLPQRQPGLDQSARLERGRAQVAACERTAPSRRRARRRTPSARGSHKACRPCASKTVCVTATAAGAGSPGP